MNFKGNIPSGYGAGDVEIYDKGTYDEIEWKNALESGAMYCRGFAQDKYWGELLPGLIDSEQFVRDILNEM
jgi:hypothetical protein